MTTTTSTSTAPTTTTTYTVRSGDTLSEIAQKFETKVSVIAKANSIENVDLIRTGQKLVIEKPEPRKPRGYEDYTVKPGDTFSEIAAAHKISQSELAKLNPQVKNIRLIHPGEKIHVKALYGPKPKPGKDPKPDTKPEPKPPEQDTKPGTKPEPKPEPKPDTRPGKGPKKSGTLPVGMPNTEGMSEAKEYALYAKYVAKHGDAKAKADLAAGKRVVVGLRVDTPFNNGPYRGTYDDRIVVLWKDGGKPRVEEFSANTEPNRRWADDPAQASKPVGRLVHDKTYHYKKSYNGNFGGNILAPDLRYGNPTVRRDVNRDHKIDSKDQVFSGDWGGQGYYFHRGGTGDTYSAGCQTMDQGRFNSFWAALGPQTEFSYVLAGVSGRGGAAD